MKKVIYAGAFRFPAADAGAARVLNNAKILKALGYEVMFISWGGDPRKEDKINEKYYYQEFEYINTYEIEDNERSFLVKVKGILQRGDKTISLLREVSLIDIVIGYGISFTSTYKLRKFCHEKNIKYISDITEWYADNEFPGGKYSPLYWLNELNMHFYQKRVENKIVISSYLDKYYFSENNLLLPPLVDLSEPKWKTEVIHTNELINNHQGIRIIYAGTPGQKDLLALVLKAFLRVLKKTNKLQFVILGVSENDAEKHGEDAIKYLKYKPNILFLGRVPQEMVPAYYKLSDFSIIVRELNRKNMAGFPTKMVESMAAGCPVILNCTSDLGKFAIDGENALILTDFTIDAVYQGFDRVLKLDKTQIAEMKHSALLSGKERFDYHAYIDQTERFINKLK